MSPIEKDRYRAWVGYVGTDLNIWGQYETLIKFIFFEYNQTSRRFDEISLPLLFLISHAIELALKENIKFFIEYNEQNNYKCFPNESSLIKSHDLENLSKEFRIAYNRLHRKVGAEVSAKKEFKKYYDELEKLIKILDRDTGTYRYASRLDKKGRTTGQSIKQNKIIDFLDVERLFEKVKTLFIGAPNSLGKFVDFIDFQRGNPSYNKGKGYLYCQKRLFSEHNLLLVKEHLDANLISTEFDTWIDDKSGEIFEIQVWEGHIYIIAIK